MCFCLGVTEVDPTKHDLLFERFVSAERNEPPDIDVDFEHERREEVIQYIYRRFGREHSGLTAAVVTYRARSAMREIGKVFGLSNDLLARLSDMAWGRSSADARRDDMVRMGLDITEPHFAAALALTHELIGFPRHLTQHSGGFVITRSRLDEVVPIAPAAMEGRTVIEWDKDDLDALGILKIDVLALGMLTCLRKGLDLLNQHYGVAHQLSSIPDEEPQVYDMISRADTVGVFQIESRAQMSMLPRLKPRCFYDLVIEVAIVRPGPIQGDMVHPYLRRRMGKEKASYPSAELEHVLGKTLGVPLFQEQAMKIAIVAAGFSPAEADQLRRAMATFKRAGLVSGFRDKMIAGMVAKGYARDFAERCSSRSRALELRLSREPCGLLRAVGLCFRLDQMPLSRFFACALLNSQPMGFYAPAQILRDARDHGVELREVDINASFWDCTLEPKSNAPRRLHPRHNDMQDDILGDCAVRLGFREIAGLAQEDVRPLTEMRGNGYDSVRDLWLRTGLPPSTLAQLAQADAFASLGLSRRDALWAVSGLNRAGDKDDLPLLRGLAFSPLEPDAKLPPMPPGEEVIEDYRFLSLSLRGHPLAFLRRRMDAQGVTRCADLSGLGLRIVSVAGLVLLRQRPGTSKGVVFLTIEDETGSANIIVWPKLFESRRAEVIGARLVVVTGQVQEESGVIHLVARRIEDRTSDLRILEEARGPKQREAVAKGRSFH